MIFCIPIKIRQIFYYVSTFGFLFWIKKKYYEFSKQYSKKHRLILSYLKVFFSKYELKQLDCKCVNECVSENAPIWVCWWQGLENAPPLVKACVKSIKKNANGRRVVVISQRNYQDYMSPIPEVILKKIHTGKMSYAFLADLIRFSLLSNHGGIWIDSTVFVAKPIPKNLQTSFYSLKQPYNGDTRYVPQKKWVVWLIGSSCQNPYTITIKNMLLDYAQNRNVLIDYFLTDYCIELFYEMNEEFKCIIDGLPLSSNLYNMNAALSEVYKTNQTFSQFNKLSYKQRHLLKNHEKSTYYFHLINGF